MDPILDLAPSVVYRSWKTARRRSPVYKGRMVGSLGAISAFSTMFVSSTVPAHRVALCSRRTRCCSRGETDCRSREAIRGSRQSTNLVASLNFNQDEISMAIGRVQLEKLPGADRGATAIARPRSEAGLQKVDGVSLIGEAPDTRNSPWFLILRLDRSRVRCNAGRSSRRALIEEGIDGVQPGYPFYPTDQPWHRGHRRVRHQSLAMVDGLTGDKPRFSCSRTAHAANAAIVRVDVHEGLKSGEARDLVSANRQDHRVLQSTTLTLFLPSR